MSIGPRGAGLDQLGFFHTAAPRTPVDGAGTGGIQIAVAP
jgi:hypothetical protein